MQHTVLPPTRGIAKAIGTKHYFTGTPCKNGHVAQRTTEKSKCLACQREISGRYHKKHRDRIVAEMKHRNREYYQKNSEKIKRQVKEYVSQNTEWRRQYAAQWVKEKTANDSRYKAMYATRRMLHRVLGLAGQRKTKRTQEQLGYTYEEIRDHLERQFTKGMSWDNYGEWHIDHIRPVKAFIEDGVTDPAVINALPNLRPVWADENMSKGCKELFLL